MSAVMIAVFGVAGFMAFMIAYSTFLRGVAFWLLWNWFVVQLGAPTISFGLALGLAVFALAFQHVPPPAERKPEDGPPTIGRNMGLTTLRYVLLMALGWVIHAFV